MAKCMISSLRTDAIEIDKRLDLQMIKAYRDNGNIRVVRNQVLNEWKTDEVLRSLALSSQSFASGVSDEEDYEAFRNVVDYYFEPYFVSTMNVRQADGYFSAIEKRMPLFFEGDEPEGSQPLILESLHHHCNFSFLYLAVKYLILQRGYNKVIMLHQQEELDPRLEACKRCVESLLGAKCVSNTFDKNWIRSLKRQVTNQTIVIYMGDMPPIMFGRTHKPGETSSFINLAVTPGADFRIEALSIARKIARLIKSEHLLLDVPKKDKVRLRTFSGRTEFFCPLSSWIYWPAVDSLYLSETSGQLEPGEKTMIPGRSDHPAA